MIYGVKHKKLGIIEYIGSHIGLEVNDRKKTHLNDLIKVLNLPFYKLLMHEAFLLYDFVVLETMTFTNKQELLERERFY